MPPQFRVAGFSYALTRTSVDASRPTVAVHHSVTVIPHCRLPATMRDVGLYFLKLTVFRMAKTVDELPAASTSTELAIPLSTQPV